MDSTTLLAIASFWILCGLAGGFIASQRGATSGLEGFVVGFLFGPLGLLMALTVKKTEPVNWEQPASDGPPPPPTR